jgi:hypothetical protein
MKKKSYAKKNANKYLIQASALLLVLFILAVFIGLYIAWMFGIRDAIMLCSGIVIGTCFYYMVEKVLRIKFLPRITKYKNYIQGDAGEETVNEALKNNLGKGNLILSGVVLEDNIGNIDHLVIGKYGVFVIETKTYRGRIVCDGDIWFQFRKIGEKTEKIELKQSPSIQARSNAGHLKSFLKQSYPMFSNVWVKAFVIFPNGQSEGNRIERKNIPHECGVFDSIDSMLEEIKKGTDSISLTTSDLLKLEDIFKTRAEDITISN